MSKYCRMVITMDAKEIKSLLKEAREAIKIKDYKLALKNCKAVLKIDRKNYVCLILFGVALQETDQKDQAPNAFKKAIEVSPDKITAWQGLAAFYEKESSGNNEIELVPIYQTLLSLENDIGKYEDICRKLVHLAVKLDIVDKCVEDLMKVEDQEKVKVIWKTFIPIFKQINHLSATEANAFEKALPVVRESMSKQELHDCLKAFLKLAYKSSQYTALISVAKTINLWFPEHEYPLEWLCKVYSEGKGNTKRILESNVTEYYEKLLSLNSNSGMALLAKAANLIQKASYSEAITILKEVAGALPNNPYVCVLLCQSFFYIQCYADAELHANEALKKLEKSDDTELLNSINYILLKSLCLQNNKEKWENVIERSKQILSKTPNNLDIIECMTRAYISLGEFDNANKCLTVIEPTKANSPVHHLLCSLSLKKQGMMADALHELDVAATNFPSSSELWIEIGKLQWNMNKYQAAYISFLKAAQLDTNSYESFIYLGNYYRLSDETIDKARRCYQKAFELNNFSEDAGSGLSDIYRLQKNKDLNLQLLKYVTGLSGARGAKWAWLRLGLLFQDQGYHQEAINNLRAAVRADPKDSLCWESLADAYFAHGSYESALKSYELVFELDPNSLYAAYQIAAIKQLIGLHEESIEQYQNILANNPKYVPALKGCGEACLSLAKSCLSQQRIGRCKELSQQAINILTVAVEEHRDMACLWKLVGDVCCLMVFLPDHLANLTVPSWMVSSEIGNKSGDALEHVCLSKEKVLQLGARCYCRALSLSQNSGLLWNDLAVNYHFQANYVSEKTVKMQLRTSAFAAAKQSITLSPKSWQNWNMLGVVCTTEEINDLRLAQHAYIKAIEIDVNNPVPWANLAVIYFLAGDVKLANMAFRRAQTADPAYNLAWIGQALIAESRQHEETIDLFQHSISLGVHQESCYGFSYQVCCKILQQLNNVNDLYYLNSIPLAADCMTWYTNVITNKPCAFNLLGVLMERQKLYTSAAYAFRKAYDLLEDDNPYAHDIICSNYARALMQLQKYEEAIFFYQQIKNATFNTQCGLAIAYFKAQKYQLSYETYESILHWFASNEDKKAVLLVAMATVAYLFQGVEDCKTLLFKSVRLKNPAVEGIFALLSLGMLNNDLQLCKLALKELLPHQDDPKYLTHIAVYRAFFHYIQGHHRESLHSLSSTIHRHPDTAELWLSLTLNQLHSYPNCNPKTAGCTAQIAMFLGRDRMDVSKVMSLVSLSDLFQNSSASLKSSQKAVFMFPHILENWAVLIASFLPWCIKINSLVQTSWLKLLIGLVRRKMEASRPMNKWLSNHERKVTLLAERFAESY